MVKSEEKSVGISFVEVAVAEEESVILNALIFMVFMSMFPFSLLYALVSTAVRKESYSSIMLKKTVSLELKGRRPSCKI